MENEDLSGNLISGHPDELDAKSCAMPDSKQFMTPPPSPVRENDVLLPMKSTVNPSSILSRSQNRALNTQNIGLVTNSTVSQNFYREVWGHASCPSLKVWSLKSGKTGFSAFKSLNFVPACLYPF